MTTERTAPLPFSRPVAVAGLSRRDTVPVALALDAAECAALAGFLDVAGIEGVRFDGTLAAWGATGWQLSGRLAARTEQRCVVTLEPVHRALDIPLERRFLPAAETAADAVDIDAADEDAPDPFGTAIELAAPIVETFALSVDPWPRAEGAAFGSRLVAPPGVEPLTDEAMRPFAGLAALRRSDAGSD